MEKTLIEGRIVFGRKIIIAILLIGTIIMGGRMSEEKKIMETNFMDKGKYTFLFQNMDALSYDEAMLVELQSSDTMAVTTTTINK